jgi:tripartite-type tricarboxylate transporter receptor subunit TctC
MRTAIVTLICAAAVVIVYSAAHGQSLKWPQKAVRIVVPTGTGGNDDFTVRTITPKLTELLGQQFIVDNRPGAGGLIGQTLVLKSPPDGYTLLLAGGSMAGARYVNANATYDVLRDFTPISLVQTTQYVMLVHPGVPARNLKEYIRLGRSQPDKMTYGTIGPGQMPYWCAMLFNSMARINAVEVTYKTGAAAVLDVMGGRLDYYFTASPAVVANRAKVRPLAVTGATRLSVFPEVPTISEAALPGYEMPGWSSVMGPAGMPREIVDSLNAAIARTLNMPEIRDRLQNLGSEVTPSTPDELAKRYADWVTRFGRIAKQTGIKPQ